jgi:hypothetical protein
LEKGQTSFGIAFQKSPSSGNPLPLLQKPIHQFFTEHQATHANYILRPSECLGLSRHSQQLWCPSSSKQERGRKQGGRKQGPPIDSSGQGLIEHGVAQGVRDARAQQHPIGSSDVAANVRAQSWTSI